MIQDRDHAPWCSTNMIREVVTAAWDQLLTFPSKLIQLPNKPLTEWSLSGFGFNPPPTHPHLRVGKHSALASCLNCFQACWASGVNNGTNMNSEKRGIQVKKCVRGRHIVLLTSSSGALILFGVILHLLWGLVRSSRWRPCCLKTRNG